MEFRNFTLRIVAFLAVILLFSAGCVPAAAPTTAAANTAAPAVHAALPTAAQAASPTPAAVASPTVAVIQPTETQAAVETQPAAAPTATEATASTPVGETAISAWCLPQDVAVSNAKDPLNPPASAKKALVTNTGLEVRGLPANGCMFLYTFAGKAPTGLKLEISELNQPKPFLTTDLQAAEGKPEVAWAFIRHAVVTVPPAERVSLTFVVRDPLGQVVQRDAVRMISWAPGEPAPKADDEDCGCGVTIP